MTAALPDDRVQLRASPGGRDEAHQAVEAAIEVGLVDLQRAVRGFRVFGRVPSSVRSAHCGGVPGARQPVFFDLITHIPRNMHASCFVACTKDGSILRRQHGEYRAEVLCTLYQRWIELFTPIGGERHAVSLPMCAAQTRGTSPPPAHMG